MSMAFLIQCFLGTTEVLCGLSNILMNSSVQSHPCTPTNVMTQTLLLQPKHLTWERFYPTGILHCHNNFLHFALIYCGIFPLHTHPRHFLSPSCTAVIFCLSAYTWYLFSLFNDTVFYHCIHSTEPRHVSTAETQKGETPQIATFVNHHLNTTIILISAYTKESCWTMSVRVYKPFQEYF